MPVFHRGAKPPRRGPPLNCEGHPLDANHDEVTCHAQGEKRNDIIRLLNCWINTIEGDCSVKPNRGEIPCMEYPLCYPEFACKEGLPETRKRPVCVKGDAPVSLLPETICYKEGPVWKLDEPPLSAWARPRVKSNQLIGGEFRKVQDCFRANGLSDFDYCPRTESCEYMKCLNEMIEADRKLHGPEAITLDCCCRPGDVPSRMRQYKCTTCEPPNEYGHKNLKCPAEIGRHGDHHDHHHKEHQHQEQHQEHHQDHHHQDHHHQEQHQHHENCGHPHHQREQFNKSAYRPKGKRGYLDKFQSRPLTRTPEQMRACLANNNPRSSGEIWDHDLDIFGHHADLE